MLIQIHNLNRFLNYSDITTTEYSAFNRLVILHTLLLKGILNINCNIIVVLLMLKVLGVLLQKCSSNILERLIYCFFRLRFSHIISKTNTSFLFLMEKEYLPGSSLDTEKHPSERELKH